MLRSTILFIGLFLGFILPPAAQGAPQRVPLGLLVTNWDCAPCAPANQVLDDWYATAGDDFALIRVHCWWPGADDPIYRDNIEQSEWLIWDTPNGPDSAPHLWVDNVVNGGVYPENMVGYLEDRARVPALLALDAAWNGADSELAVTVDIPADLPAADYRLFVAVTEDSIAAQGSNGEPMHHQAFRFLYPDTTGLVVVAAAGVQELTVPTPLNNRWRIEQLRAVAYVQDRGTGEVMNAATLKLVEMPTAVAQETAPAGVAVSAYPNPFNPVARIRYATTNDGEVTVRVHDLAGRTVRTLVQGPRRAGQHEAVWQGRDRNGRAMSSGVYLVQVRSRGQVASQKLVLAR